MNKILYISGDGIRDQIANKIYTKHFISDAKNYFISKEFKFLVGDCDILNFSWWFGHPRFIVKLESSGLRGTTRIKIIIIKIINFISRIIIYWKIKINSVDLIVFSDNLFFLEYSNASFKVLLALNCDILTRISSTPLSVSGSNSFL